MKIVGKILAVLYSIVFSLVLLLISILINCTNIFKGSFYKDVLNSVKLNELKASDLGLSDDPNQTVEEVLVDKLKEVGINSDVSKKIINNQEIKEVLGNLMADIVNYSIDPKEVPQISKNDVEKILNNKDVKEIIDENLSQEDIDKLVNEANKMLKEIGGGLNVGN